MIKILFIHSQLVCGGAEQALFDLVTLMDRTKFDITVLVQFEGGVWEQKFRDAGIHVVSPWSCQRLSRNPLVKIDNLLKRKRIAKAMERDGEGMVEVCLSQNFDIIVSYGVWFMWRMGFSGSAKTVKFIHGDLATNPKYCENILGSIELLRRFDRIICVSETARLSLESRTGITEGVCTHFNPMNSDNVRRLAQQEVSIPNDMPVICGVGRLAKEKGFDRLIRIHKKLWDEGTFHRLVLVGDGPEMEALRGLVRELRAEDSVVLTGYASNPYPYMRKSKLLVCPSYTEGLGLVAMEAIFLGTPVVSSAPSVEELFGGEVCGLVTENDDGSLEDGIRRMLTDQALYQQARDGARRRSEFFDGRNMAREVETEFLALVDEGKG